ncbi:MAG: hypothetical protein ABIQ16_08010 [Polyangiaceae bacterium]
MQKIDLRELVDDLPFDLITQVERRLGIDRQSAMELLGGWLTAYEPVARTSVRFLK